MILIGFLSFIACKESEHKEQMSAKELEVSLSKPIDSTLIKKIELLGTKDQTLRLMLPEVASKFGSGSEEEKYFWSLINEQDSINEKEIIGILGKFGWLGKSKIGDNANQSLWLVIQHAPLELQEKYLPLLKKSVAEKESEGWHLAFLEDRILMRNNKDQLYGSQAKWDKELGKMKIHDIEDVENVNKRREELGLESLEEYAKMNAYVFDQKNKD